MEVTQSNVALDHEGFLNLLINRTAWRSVGKEIPDFPTEVIID
jgi:hypothetical protein